MVVQLYELVRLMSGVGANDVELTLMSWAALWFDFQSAKGRVPWEVIMATALPPELMPFDQTPVAKYGKVIVELAIWVRWKGANNIGRDCVMLDRSIAVYCVFLKSHPESQLAPFIYDRLWRCLVSRHARSLEHVESDDTITSENTVEVKPKHDLYYSAYHIADSRLQDLKNQKIASHRAVADMIPTLTLHDVFDKYTKKAVEMKVDEVGRYVSSIATSRQHQHHYSADLMSSFLDQSAPIAQRSIALLLALGKRRESHLNLVKSNATDILVIPSTAAQDATLLAWAFLWHDMYSVDALPSDETMMALALPVELALFDLGDPAVLCYARTISSLASCVDQFLYLKVWRGCEEAILDEFINIFRDFFAFHFA